MLSFSISQTHIQTHFSSLKVSYRVHLRGRKRILLTSFILNIIVRYLSIYALAYLLILLFLNIIYLDDIKVDKYFISLVSLLFCLLCSASLCIGMNPVPRSPAILLASRHRKYFLYHITLYHIILYHIILYHITVYYIISYFIVLCYIISYYIL